MDRRWRDLVEAIENKNVGAVASTLVTIIEDELPNDDEGPSPTDFIEALTEELEYHY